MFFLSEKFPNEDLFCAPHYCHVIEEGPPENFFNATGGEENVNAVQDAGMVETECIDQAVFAASNHAKDIDFV